MGLLEIIGLSLLSCLALVGIVCLVLVTIFYVRSHKSAKSADAPKPKLTKAQRDLIWAKELITKLEKQVEVEKAKV